MGTCVSGDSNFSLLHACPWRTAKVPWSIILGITNKFSRVGKLSYTKSINNENWLHMYVHVYFAYICVVHVYVIDTCNIHIYTIQTCIHAHVHTSFNLEAQFLFQETCFALKAFNWLDKAHSHGGQSLHKVHSFKCSSHLRTPSQLTRKINHHISQT